MHFGHTIVYSVHGLYKIPVNGQVNGFHVRVGLLLAYQSGYDLAAIMLVDQASTGQLGIESCNHNSMSSCICVTCTMSAGRLYVAFGFEVLPCSWPYLCMTSLKEDLPWPNTSVNPR